MFETGFADGPLVLLLERSAAKFLREAVWRILKLAENTSRHTTSFQRL